MKIKRLNSNAIIPTRGTEHSAGYDIYAAEDAVIESGDTVMISTGIAMEIPWGHYGALYSRSGLATKEGLRIATGTSVIDADYRGEVKVPLHNDSGSFRYIHAGDRIAQIVVTPYKYLEFEEVDELSDTDRGSRGFGSTG